MKPTRIDDDQSATRREPQGRSQRLRIVLFGDLPGSLGQHDEPGARLRGASDRGRNVKPDGAVQNVIPLVYGGKNARIFVSRQCLADMERDDLGLGHRRGVIGVASRHVAKSGSRRGRGWIGPFGKQVLRLGAAAEQEEAKQGKAEQGGGGDEGAHGKAFCRSPWHRRARAMGRWNGCRRTRWPALTSPLRSTNAASGRSPIALDREGRRGIQSPYAYLTTRY